MNSQGSASAASALLVSLSVSNSVSRKKTKMGDAGMNINWELTKLDSNAYCRKVRVEIKGCLFVQLIQPNLAIMLSFPSMWKRFQISISRDFSLSVVAVELFELYSSSNYWPTQNASARLSTYRAVCGAVVRGADKRPKRLVFEIDRVSLEVVRKNILTRHKVFSKV